MTARRNGPLRALKAPTTVRRRNLALSDTRTQNGAQIGAQPKCAIHGTLCAYPGPHPALCPFCHSTWRRITAPAIAPGWGYGETPTEHLTAHLATARRNATRNARRTPKPGAPE